jgi:hypothetical protein
VTDKYTALLLSILHFQFPSILLNIICEYLELLFNFLEVHCQSSTLLCNFIYDDLMIMVVPQTVYCQMRVQLANNELERWKEVVMGKFELLSLYLHGMNE